MTVAKERNKDYDDTVSYTTTTRGFRAMLQNRRCGSKTDDLACQRYETNWADSFCALAGWEQ